MKKPKKPEASAEQKATEIRQRSLLDNEIEEQEEMLKKLARGKLGRGSLLSGAPRNTSEAASGASRGAGGGGGSLLGNVMGDNSQTPSIGARTPITTSGRK